MNAFALAEAAYAQAKLGRRPEAMELLARCIKEYPQSPWSVSDHTIKSLETDAPHAHTEAAKLLASGPQPPTPLDTLGEQQPARADGVRRVAGWGVPSGYSSAAAGATADSVAVVALEVAGAVRESRHGARAYAAVEDLPPLAPLRTPQKAKEPRTK